MLVFTFLIGALSMSFANCQVYNVSAGLSVELQGAFPANTFNSSCVSSSCPNLSNPSVCSTSGSSYDLNATISALISCAQTSSICGLKMEPRPITLIQFSLAQLLQDVPLSGVCYTAANCAYTNVIPNFTVISGANGAVALSLNLPNLAFVGTISCNLTQSVTPSFGLSLPSITFPTANAGFQYNFNYSSSIEINNADNSAKVIGPVLGVTGVSFEGLQFPDLPGIPDYLSTFKTLVSKVLGQMSLATVLGEFYQGLVQSALQVAANNCVH